MTYQVLARKWRPQDFSSVVGQESTVTALRNALREGRIAQAYLFSGIRGVGKTSVARVLAKALNCENGPAADPCNDCQTCTDITAGSDLDVIEVDAATYSKVEQVRELTESLKYGPARDRYKVVVIDEIHRLSRQAFDALLKIVEEPPAHLVFIFATTEVDAVPATILSRCQEFHFRRVRPGLLAAHLRMLAGKETIEVSDTALRLIARASEGSVRDAVALLDQLATFGSGQVADADAARILGGVGAAVHYRLLKAIVEGSGKEVAGVVNDIEQEGWDPRHVYGEFLAYCRDALHLALGAEHDAIELPEDDVAQLATLATDTGYENLLRLLHQLLGSENTIRRSEAGVLAVEIAWLRAAELPKLTSIEALLRGGAPPQPATKRQSRKPGTARKSSPEPRKTQPKTVTAPPVEKIRAEPACPATDIPPPESSRPEPSDTRPSEPQKLDSDDSQTATSGTAHRDSSIEDFLTEVSRRRQPLAAHLQESLKLDFADGSLAIYTPPGDQWLANALARGKNRAVLEESLASVFGEGTTWKLLEGDHLPESSLPDSTPETEDPILQHPVVQTALDIFGGTARAIKSDDSKEMP
jgi:DNA polymerase-3 subunit gamma/tau